MANMLSCPALWMRAGNERLPSWPRFSHRENSTRSARPAKCQQRSVHGVHVTLRKPITHQSGVQSLKAEYSRMLRDYRKHTRFAVMTPAVATDEDSRDLPITVTNVGEGGVGLTSVETLRIGGVLSFRMRLPEFKNEISIEARVLWTRPYGAAGCEFVSVPPLDLQLLHAWLASRYRIKKPLIPV